MKINQVLVESSGATVAFAFGRFNPAHQGHIEVWRTVEQAGANWFIGTNSSTLGPNDPLTFQQKSAWMTEIYPAIAGHIVAEQSVLTLAAYIFKKTRKNENATVAYITDAADWAWSGKLLNQYNGVEGAHGYYKFAEIAHVPSPRVSSATALRDAARADDKVAFYHASGTDPKSKVAGLTYFDTVKQAVEKYPLPVKKAKKVKEQGVAEGSLSEKINPKTLTRGFVQEKDLGWYTLQAVGDFASRMANEPPTMEIYAMLKPEAGKRQGKQIGQLSLKIAQGMFLKDNPGTEALVAGGVDVDPAYQRKGVASAMYAFAKELGNDVIASVDQSDDAKAMWAGMRAKGVAEGASSIEQKIIKLYKQGLSDDEIASRLKIDSDDVKSVLDDYEWVADTTGELKGVAEDSSQKTFTVVYYSKKTDRNVTKTIKANNQSQVWDQLKSKGIDVVSVKEQGLNEFAPGSGGGESGRWYTDDQMTDLVGDGWWNDLDISGDIPKQQMIQEAQAWLDDQGYSVHVLNCKVNDDDMEWFIEGSFQNSNFAKKGMAEAKADPTGSWVVYNGSKVTRFKTHSSAKAYAEKNGGKVASSEYYHDKIQKQGVAESEQKTVAKTWDQMTSQEKSSGVKGRTVWNEKTQRYYTVFDVPDNEVDEASLATMRDYFAGDENARDPMDITQQRLHFAKDKNARPTVDKRFRSPAEYQAWLKQNKLRQISGANESTNDKGWTLINKSKS